MYGPLIQQHISDTVNEIVQPTIAFYENKDKEKDQKFRDLLEKSCQNEKLKWTNELKAKQVEFDGERKELSRAKEKVETELKEELKKKEQRDEEEETKVFKSELTVEAKVDQLFPKDKMIYDQQLVRTWKEFVQTTFKDIDLKPNSNQLGTAIVAAYSLNQCTRQFWIIPSGMGKTRVIASAIAIMHTKLD